VPSVSAEYKGEGFAAEHGSWNREPRGGYEVIRLPMVNGHATGEYEDFLTGFVLSNEPYGPARRRCRSQGRLAVRLRRRFALDLACELCGWEVSSPS